MSGTLARRDVVALLDVDPDLAAGIEAQDLPLARRHSVAATLELEPPSWDPQPVRDAAQPGWLGLFVCDGILLRRVRVGRRAACELFGPGDVVRPWDADGEYAPLPIAVDWMVLKPTRLAVLDTAFVLRMARWPTVNSRLVSRLAQRARHLALIQALTHLPRAHARLLILFWLLAERWGKVSSRGVFVTLPVTHEVLAMIVGTQRPTVTVALQRLTRSGYLVRERRDRWLLTNQAVQTLSRPESFDLIDGGELVGDEADDE
ncbi:MAG TPA: Crp/Fnr family transcriptional regulator [Solirubrobacteraceae bacterium]